MVACPARGPEAARAGPERATRRRATRAPSTSRASRATLRDARVASRPPPSGGRASAWEKTHQPPARPTDRNSAHARSTAFFCSPADARALALLPRRKHKAVHKTTSTDDKRLQNTLKRLGVNVIPGIEEVNIFKDDTVIHFTNPKVQASIAANTYVVSGPSQTKKLQDLLPGIINQLGPDNLEHLKKLAAQYGADGDDVPAVENFEAASKQKSGRRGGCAASSRRGSRRADATNAS